MEKKIKSVYDIIIIGGGSGGAIVANRLSEVNDKSILLIEAGEVYDPNEYPDQIALAKNVGGDINSVWEPTKEIDSETPTKGLFRAKILGGGSAINAAAFLHAPKSDFDRWAKNGLAGWGFSQVMPYYKKIESADFGDNEWHGRNGLIPVHLLNKNEVTKTAQNFIEAAVNAGITYQEDLNIPFPKGVGMYSVNIKEGIRINTGMSYLSEEVRKRPNFDIIGNTIVNKITFENGNVTGILLNNGDNILAKKVIISSGAIGTASILLRSGIGPKKQLEALKIPTIVDLPVGQFIMDQPQIYLQVNINGDEATLPPIGGKVWQQSSFAEGEELDYYLGFNHFANLSKSPTKKAFGIIVCGCRPVSRGKLELDSNDVFAPPRVSLNLLSEEKECEIMLEAIKQVSNILEQKPLKNQVVSVMFGDGSLLPSSVEECKALIRKNVESCLHITSSAPMGDKNNPMAVVDNSGKVHGINGLYIADASILPDVPSVATNPTVMMAAEYIADQIKN